MSLADQERYPLLTEHGRAMLEWLREHPSAPRYTARCGNRLTAAYLERVRTFEAELGAAPRGWEPGRPPDWLPGYVEVCLREVPFYRDYGADPARFLDLPTTDRGDLSREPWACVPDSQPLDDLIVHATSGTTGHPLKIISHPVVGACYLPLLKSALRQFGVELRAGRGQVGCILVGWQRRAYTYTSVTPQQDDSGYVKLNLHPDDWRDPDDRARFLDACAPEVYTGDPLAFAELARLPLTHQPRALISTALTLLPGLRRELEARFGCPVLDVYSMNESGPIGVTRDGAFYLLQHRLYIEILDPRGQPCPPGVRGEVTLTGGFNPFLPLLRYRTNDYAALEYQDGQPVLTQFEGRAPVVFRGSQGQRINSLDVTGALRHLALPQFSLHQRADGGLRLKVHRGADLSGVRAALLGLFELDTPLTIDEVERFGATGDKVIQYSSDADRAE